MPSARGNALSSLARFVKFALWPGRSLISPTFGPAGALALVSGYVASYVGSAVAVIVIGALAFVAALFVAAGYRLQREKDMAHEDRAHAMGQLSDLLRRGYALARDLDENPPERADAYKYEYRFDMWVGEVDALLLANFPERKNQLWKPDPRDPGLVMRYDRELLYNWNGALAGLSEIVRELRG